MKLLNKLWETLLAWGEEVYQHRKKYKITQMY